MRLERKKTIKSVLIFCITVKVPPVKCCSSSDLSVDRLVEVVQRRNEIIDCLEMDRLREKEEDRSVGAQLGIFSAGLWLYVTSLTDSPLTVQAFLGYLTVVTMFYGAHTLEYCFKCACDIIYLFLINSKILFKKVTPNN